MAAKGEFELLRELERTARSLTTTLSAETDFQNFKKIAMPIFRELDRVREREAERRNPKKRFSSIGRNL